MHLSIGLTFLLLCLLHQGPHCLWPHGGSPQPRPKQLEVVTTGAAQQLFLEPAAAVRKLQKNWGGFCAASPGAGASPQPVRNPPPWDEENSQSRPASITCKCYCLWPCYLPGQQSRGWGQCHKQPGDLSLFLTGVRSPCAALGPNLGFWEQLQRDLAVSITWGVCALCWDHPRCGSRKVKDKLPSHQGASPHIGLQQPEMPAPVFLHSRPQTRGISTAHIGGPLPLHPCPQGNAAPDTETPH